MPPKMKSHTIKNLSVFLTIATLFSPFAPVAFAIRPTNQEIKRNVPRSLNISLNQQLSRREFWRMHICQMSGESVREQLNYEIERYKNRAPDIFKIDENLIRRSDPKALLINLSTLNYLFDKYNLFTEKLIALKRRIKNKSFILTSEPNPEPNCLQSTTSDLGGIYLNHLNSYLQGKRIAEIDARTNWCSKRNLCEAYESILVNGFGHLMLYLYTIEKYNLDMSNVNAISVSKFVDQVIGPTFNSFLNQNCTRKNPKPTPYDEDLKRILNRCPTQLSNTTKERYLSYLRLTKPGKQREFLNIVQTICAIWNPNSVRVEETVRNEARVIKSDLTRSIDTSNRIQCPMGECGNSSPIDFMAEAFAHLECSNRKDVSKLGKETEKFIVEEMKFLPKEKSTFCNH